MASCRTSLAASFQFCSEGGVHNTTPVLGVLSTPLYVANTTTQNHSTFFKGIRSRSVPVTFTLGTLHAPSGGRAVVVDAAECVLGDPGAH